MHVDQLSLAIVAAAVWVLFLVQTWRGRKR